MRINPRAFFVAMSKNFTSSLGQFGVHAGVNKSRETVDGEDVSGWFGVDKSLNEDLTLLGEYELARNDESDEAWVFERRCALGSGASTKSRPPVQEFATARLRRTRAEPRANGPLYRGILMRIHCLIYLLVIGAPVWAQEERTIDNFAGVGVRAMGMGGLLWASQTTIQQPTGIQLGSRRLIGVRCTLGCCAIAAKIPRPLTARQLTAS